MPGITNPAEPFFKDGVWGWDTSDWHKLAMLWGYTDRWAEFLGKTMTADEAFSEVCTTVPAGEVWVLQLAFIRNASGVRGSQSIRLVTGGQDYIVKLDTAPVATVPLLLTGEFTLKEGDKVRIYHAACLTDDVVDAGVWGYKMYIDE